MPKTFLKAGEDRRLVAGLDIDDAAGRQPGLGERGRKEILARNAPQHAPAGPGGDAGRPQGGRGAINRAIGAAGNLMQRAERQPSSRQYPVDLRDAERQHLAPTRCAAFQARHALPEFGQYEMGRGRGHCPSQQAPILVCSIFVLITRRVNPTRDTPHLSETCNFFRTSDLADVRNLSHISDMTTVAPDTDIRSRVLARIESKPEEVWTPGDFADLGGRAAVDKTLQRLAATQELRRIDRGLYDRPRANSLTGRATVPDYRAVIRAVTRRDNARVVIDGMTAANDLGLTTAVPARIEVLVDARLKPIKLGSQEIHFKYAAPSRLYWADRPGMRVVQALHWMQDMLSQNSERKRIQTTLRRLLSDPKHGEAIREDLRAGLSAVPIWMQEFLRQLLSQSAGLEGEP